ncbi:MAG TPA: dihydroorotase [Stellaceae bacterium]|jgi:dihydroorotase|nr:dihydroorotase [Stellaceae bacterium]
MSGLRRLFRGARLIDPESGRDTVGDVIVVGDRIAAIGANISAEGLGADVEVVELDGLCLAPGLVDMRVQLREPGGEHIESIESGSQAAAAGGVTTMIALPNTEPPVDDVSVVEFLARRAREVRLAKIHTYAAATKRMEGKELTEIGLLAANGVVGFTDGVKAIANALVMRRVLAYARTFDQLIVQHPEEPSLAGAGEVTEGEVATRLGLAGITPAAEVIMVERDLRLVAITGARYHVAHVSTEAAIEAIRGAKAAGLPVTCDTAPPYFALNETAIGDYRTFAKLSPPLRAERDRQAVVAGLADGTIDAIASDHSPWDQDSKRLPFSSASYGIVGLETLLPLSLELYHNRHLTLLDVLRRLTIGPARILRLGVGRLAAGAPADFVVFDPGATYRIQTERFRSKSKNAPFDGRPVQGRVELTVVDGRTIFERDAALG